MSLSRRGLFKIVSAGLVLQACLPHKNKGSVIRNPETIYSGFRTGEPHESTPAGLSISTPLSIERVTFANEIHSIIICEQFDLKVFISKLELFSYAQVGNGPYIEINPDGGNYFYGHGVIDEKRKVLYTTQAKATKTRDGKDRENEKGYVYVHSIPDFKIIDKFPTFGHDPHDVKIFNDELIVCNGGSDSSITFIDLATRKLIREYKVNVEHLQLRHVEIVNDQNFLVATLSNHPEMPTPLYGLNLKNGLKVYEMPSGLEKTLMRVQLLSMIHHEGHIYATCPATHTVLVWNLQGDFIGGQYIPSAAGLAVSKELGGVIVGSGKLGEKARILYLKNGSLKVHKLEWATGVSGSHATIV
ncbi:MAG: DUF1513 domain-containing protein [Bacteriovoracaceae bacterium]